MLIAIASQTNGDNAKIDEHFGRCAWFCIYDNENKEEKYIQNPAAECKDKAGSDAAGFLFERGVKMVVAGRFGAKATETLRKKNIQIVIPEKLTGVRDFINQIKVI